MEERLNAMVNHVDALLQSLGASIDAFLRFFYDSTNAVVSTHPFICVMAFSVVLTFIVVGMGMLGMIGNSHPDNTSLWQDIKDNAKESVVGCVKDFFKAGTGSTNPYIDKD